MLISHILDLDGYEGAVFKSLRENLSGLVGVNVGLDDLVVLNENKRIADAEQEVAQNLGRTVVLAVDDKLCVSTSPIRSTDGSTQQKAFRISQ